MDRGELARQRILLLKEREAQLARIRALREAGLGASMQESARELSSYDQHTADQGTEMFEREKDFGLLAAARQTLERVDAALRRIDAGTYGTCEACGRPIDPARLQALPFATRCVDCEAEEEEQTLRAVEEAAYRPRFSQSFTEGADQTAYDGEDTWEDLARYGTANSPQDAPSLLELDEFYTDAFEDVESLKAPGATARGRAPATRSEDGAEQHEVLGEDMREGDPF